jgi:hypothetical protein
VKSIHGVSALFLSIYLFGVGGSAEAQNSQPATQPSTVVLLKDVKNSVQLGIEVNGQFAYPFTFTSNPKPNNGDVQISASGLISGTPSKIEDETTEITVTDNNGKLIAKYSVVLHSANTMTVMLRAANSTGAAVGSEPSPAKKSTESSPNLISTNPVYVGGDTVTGVAKPASSLKNESGTSQPNEAPSPASGESSRAPSDPGKPETPANQKSGGGTIVTITCSPDKATAAQSGCDGALSATAMTDTKDNFSYQFHKSLLPGDQVFVSTSSGSPHGFVVQTPPNFLGEEMRAIVGYQQAGASSSNFNQAWFLDFYISRPIAFRRKSEGSGVPWRWWGNVRVASFPQPGNQTVAEVAAGLSTQLGALKLNQLAQGAEFLTGVEYQPFKSIPFRGFSENTRQVFTFGLIAGFGATGFFSAPSQDLQVFAVPAADSPQLATFQKAFPGVTTTNVAFISPDLVRFPKQYLGGFRLETHYVDPTGKPLTSPPAMLAFTIGQNQVVTGNKLSGVVGRLEAFYPLPFGNRGESTAGAFSALYLFGTTQMRLGRTQIAPPLALAPAAGVSASDPTVTLVPLANTRDVYRIGFGVDLVGFISSLTGGTSKKSTTGTATSKPDGAPQNPQPAAGQSP